MDPKDVPGYGNGGQAFPNDIAMNTLDRGGMSLRDYFAAKAMHALLVADGTTYFENRANEAYAMADAMLAERAKERQ